MASPGREFCLAAGRSTSAESGFRVGIGLWLDRYQTWGIGGRYFDMGPEDIGFRAASDGSLILGRPFFNASLGEADALVVAFPGESRGGWAISTATPKRRMAAYLWLGWSVWLSRRATFGRWFARRQRSSIPVRPIENVWTRLSQCLMRVPASRRSHRA